MSALRTVVRDLAKASLANAFHHSGALRLFSTMRRIAGGSRVHVLAFHRVVDDMGQLPREVIPSLCITTASFERLCRLAQRRFDVLPLVEAIDVLTGRRPAPSRRDVLALTFDDGYRDVALRALPVLQRLGLPATAFITTGLIGQRRLLEHDRLHALFVRARDRGVPLAPDAAAGALPPLLRLALGNAGALLGARGPAAALDHLIATLPAVALARIGDLLEEKLGERVELDEGAYVMSEAELRAIARGGVELGAHTVDHVVLTHEPAERMRRQLAEPRATLEAIAGLPCRSFAYCNGLWAPTLVEAVRAAGYDVAVTTEDAPNLVGAGRSRLLVGRKTLWEGHVRGLAGRFSDAHARAHLEDLFGALSLTAPVDGRVEPALAAAALALAGPVTEPSDEPPLPSNDPRPGPGGPGEEPAMDAAALGGLA